MLRVGEHHPDALVVAIRNVNVILVIYSNGYRAAKARRLPVPIEKAAWHVS
jgi:hypothetical protein